MILLAPKEEQKSNVNQSKFKFPELAFISSAQIDVIAEPMGGNSSAKSPAKIKFKLGGPAGNGAKVCVENNIASGVVAVQRGGIFTAHVKRLAARSGLVPFLKQRSGDPALSVATPNGRPGAFNLLVQRQPPILPAELTGNRARAIECARSLIVGPMHTDAQAHKLHRRISKLSRENYRALLPHPSLIGDSRFPMICRQYDYVQMNATEARHLDASTNDLAELALRLRHIRDGRGDLAITNGREPGYMWADGRWWSINPIPVSTVNDVGAGDVFCTAWVVARQVFDADARSALDYAVRCAAAAIANSAIPRFA